IALRLVLAVLIEGAWELLENSDLIINRYRAGTASFDYFGDSIVNSIGDNVAMMVGFTLAFLLPVWSVIALAVILEIALAVLIPDIFSLNPLIIAHPMEATRGGQSAPQLQ